MTTKQMKNMMNKFYKAIETENEFKINLYKGLVKSQVEFDLDNEEQAALYDEMVDRLPEEIYWELAG